MKLWGDRESKEKNRLYLVTGVLNRLRSQYGGGAQGSGVPGIEARDRETGQGGRSWPIGLWDGVHRKEMLTPFVCISQR